MKLLIRNTKIIGTALDTYTGPEQFIDAPDKFDHERMDAYRYVDGELQPIIPQTVTRFQARAALYQAGLLDQVETLMNDPETPTLARLAWQDAQSFERQSPTIAAMATALGLTDAQLDDLFIAAAGITA